MPETSTSLLILAMIYSGTFGANILVMFPLPLTSHFRSIQPLFKELAMRGHNVTVYSAYPMVSPIANYTDVVVGYNFNKEQINSMRNKKPSVWPMTIALWNMGIEACEKVLQQKVMQQLITSSNQSYDLIIAETLFLGEPFVAFGHKFNAPVINFYPVGSNAIIDHILGNAYAIAHIPNYKLPFGRYMSFLERLQNFLVELSDILSYRLYYLPKQEELMRKYFLGAEAMPPLLQQLRETSFTLLDIDVSQSYPKPYLPNFAAIGGLHMTSTKPLPHDLQKFMDEAPHGVIYFSFGSVFTTSGMGTDSIQAFLAVFSQLPQRVILKWEEDVLPGQTDNIKIGKWLPQLEILAHPKCKLFITHGGSHSTLEAAYYGVPLLGIPIMADQPLNMIRVEGSGFGLMLDNNNITEKSISWALNILLNTKSFKENAMHQASLVSDRPISPLQEAVFWVEYVIRHKGAPHLRSAATYLSWYQNLLLDVIAFITALSAAALLFSYYAITNVITVIRARKTRTIRKNDKKDD